MRNLTLGAMALACMLLLGAVFYVRFNGAGSEVRVGVLVASLLMAALMVRLVARAGGSER